MAGREDGDGSQENHVCQVSSQPPMRVAQYLRMSTEHQQYSTENQADAIARYAEQHCMEIVSTYADEGKSGLDIDWRPSLQRLIADVTSGQADYRQVLVYDISRWGRFQDPDQAAHLEFLCRDAGIGIEYCAEQFVNDGSFPSALMKMVLRTQAGEYSRMLSLKVFAGQCRLIQMGYRQGGPVGFGLRRMRIDHTGAELGILKRGQHKSLQTDRVIQVPGPEHEIATVERIYRWFVEDRLIESEIAARLNAEGINTDFGRPWTRATVHQVLINEKYIGNNVFNRKSFKLKNKRVTNPPEKWVRKDGAFEAIIDPGLFFTAQGMILERSRKVSSDELLDKLRRLYQERGMLSGIIISEAENMPSPTVYSHRFGSLLRAYELVGYTPWRDYRYLTANRILRTLYPAVLADAIARIRDQGGAVERDENTDLLTINGEFTASIVVARCLYTRGGAQRWNIRFDTSLAPDLTVAIRLNAENTAALDYYLLPLIDIAVPRLRLAADNGLFLDAYRFDTLDYFFGMAARVALRGLQ